MEAIKEKRDKINEMREKALRSVSIAVQEAQFGGAEQREATGI
jgi:hypothetical protein